MQWTAPRTWALLWTLTYALQVDSKLVRSYNHVKSICSMWGGHHYKTFDGDVYQFPGMCEYNLASECHSSFHDFSVHVKKKMDDKGKITVSQVTVTIKDLPIHLTKQLIMVGGEIVSTPYHVSGVLIEENSAYTNLHYKLGLSVMWNRDDAVMVELDSKYSNRTCGLCGDYNGVPIYDEFIHQGRHIGAIEFGNKQRVHNPNVECEDPYEEDIEEDEQQQQHQQQQDLCAEAQTSCARRLLSSAWASCASVLDPGPYINACTMDLCHEAQPADGSSMCVTLAEYSRQCSHARGTPPNWRKNRFCAITCPYNMVYLESGSPCMTTCTHLESNSLCEEHNIDGCFCPEGTVFDDLSKRGCIPKEQCQCKHDRIYDNGEVLRTDTEECACHEGRWSCKSHARAGTCAVEEGSHVTTYDGKTYNYHGDCFYVLSKDCVDSKFSILGELAPCSSQDWDTCLKRVVLRLLGDKKNDIVIQANGKVQHNAEVNLPYSNGDVTIFQPSSFHIILQTHFGLQLQIQLVPIMQLYISLDESFKTKTCGLCGNYNMVLSDDLRSPQGMVEGTAASFANSWKAQTSCADTPDRLEDPCSLSVDNENFAEHWCSLLKMKESNFSKCHSAVNPEIYYKRCKYASCTCDKSEECLCAVVSSYVRACATKGIFLLGWRDTVCNKYTDHCPATQTFSYQLQGCQRTCRSLSSDRPACSPDFLPVDGCACPEGLYLDDSGMCVQMNKCPCLHNGDYIKPGKSITIKEEHCVCTNGKLHCRSWRILPRGCPTPMVFFNCSATDSSDTGMECVRTCKHRDVDCISAECESGCRCPDGLLEDGRGHCVQEHDCPCHHDGHYYASGSQIPVKCNNCTCYSGKWICSNNVCPSTCTIYGSGHYQTFDDQRFGFNGECGYVAVQDRCGSPSGKFHVITENVPCGTTGTTCSKSVRIVLGRTELKLSDGAYEVLDLGTGPTVKYTVRNVGLYLVIESVIGFTAFWDRRTTVRVILQPEHMGKVCGLCGNFNGDGKDDFTTQNQLLVSNVLEFANSWKVSSSCPDAEDNFDPCFKNPNRHTWAKIQCGIIKGETFKNCHAKVDPNPYFENCVKDSCACDNGGDCECFCTAVAAYAQACNEAGVCVAWRTPDICPVYCDYYNGPAECTWHYSPCHTPCYKTCLHPDGICSNPLPNLEGCYPVCPPDKPIFDEGQQICVEECEGCFINGHEYKPGEEVPTDIPCTSCICNQYGNLTCNQIPGCCMYNGTEYEDHEVIYNVTDNMGMCYYAICINETVIHINETCTTSPTPSTTPTIGPPVDTSITTVVSSTTTLTTGPPVDTHITTVVSSTTTLTTGPPVDTHITTVVSSTTSPASPTSTATSGPSTTQKTTPSTPPLAVTTGPSTGPPTYATGPQVSITAAPGTTPPSTSTTATGPPISITSMSTPRTVTVETTLSTGAPSTIITTPSTTAITHEPEPPTTTTTPWTTPPPTSTTTTGPPQSSTTPETLFPPTSTTTTGLPPSTTTPGLTPGSSPTTGQTTTPTLTTTTGPPPSTSTTPPATPTTTICVDFCEWTEWFDVDTPSVTEDDDETYDNIRENGNDICQKPEDIRCRAIGYEEYSFEDFVENTGQVVQCNVSFGLLCEKNKQTRPPKKCFDYEIQVYCCKPCITTTVTTSSSPTSISTMGSTLSTTTPVVTPGSSTTTGKTTTTPGTTPPPTSTTTTGPPLSTTTPPPTSTTTTRPSPSTATPVLTPGSSPTTGQITTTPGTTPSPTSTTTTGPPPSPTTPETPLPPTSTTTTGPPPSTTTPVVTPGSSPTTGKTTATPETPPSPTSTTTTGPPPSPTTPGTTPPPTSTITTGPPPSPTTPVVTPGSSPTTGQITVVSSTPETLPPSTSTTTTGPPISITSMSTPRTVTVETTLPTGAPSTIVTTPSTTATPIVTTTLSITTGPSTGPPTYATGPQVSITATPGTTPPSTSTTATGPPISITSMSTPRTVTVETTLSTGAPSTIVTTPSTTAITHEPEPPTTTTTPGTTPPPTSTTTTGLPLSTTTPVVTPGLSPTTGKTTATPGTTPPPSTGQTTTTPGTTPPPTSTTATGPPPSPTTPGTTPPPTSTTTTGPPPSTTTPVVTSGSSPTTGQTTTTPGTTPAPTSTTTTGPPPSPTTPETPRPPISTTTTGPPPSSTTPVVTPGSSPTTGQTTTTPGTTPAPTSTTTTGPPPSPTTPETPRPPISTTTTGPPPSTTTPVVTPGSSPTTGKTTATPGTTPAPTLTTTTGPPPSPTTPETPRPPISTTTTGPPPSSTTPVVTPGSSPTTGQTTTTPGTTPAPTSTTTTGPPPSPTTPETPRPPISTTTTGPPPSTTTPVVTPGSSPTTGKTTATPGTTPAPTLTTTTGPPPSPTTPETPRPPISTTTTGPPPSSTTPVVTPGSSPTTGQTTTTPGTTPAPTSTTTTGPPPSPTTPETPRPPISTTTTGPPPSTTTPVVTPGSSPTTGKTTATPGTTPAPTLTTTTGPPPSPTTPETPRPPISTTTTGPPPSSTTPVVTPGSSPTTGQTTATPGTTPAPTLTTTTGPPPSPTTPETPRPPISTTTTGPPPSTTTPVVTPGPSPTTGKTTATPGTTPPPSTGQTTTTPGTTPPPTSTTATGPPPSPTTPGTTPPPTSTTTTGPPPSTTTPVVTSGSSPTTGQTTTTPGTTPAPTSTTTTGPPPSPTTPETPRPPISTTTTGPPPSTTTPVVTPGSSPTTGKTTATPGTTPAPTLTTTTGPPPSPTTPETPRPPISTTTTGPPPSSTTPVVPPGSSPTTGQTTTTPGTTPAPTSTTTTGPPPSPTTPETPRPPISTTTTGPSPSTTTPVVTPGSSPTTGKTTATPGTTPAPTLTTTTGPPPSPTTPETPRPPISTTTTGPPPSSTTPVVTPGSSPTTGQTTATPGTTPAPTLTTTTGPPPSPTTPETPRPPISTTTTGPPPSTTTPVVTPGPSPTTGKTTATPGTTPPPSTGQTTTTPGTTPPPTSTTATGPPPSPTTPGTTPPPTSTTTTGPPPSTTTPVVTSGSSPTTGQTTTTPGTTPAPTSTTTTGPPPSPTTPETPRPPISTTTTGPPPSTTTPVVTSGSSPTTGQTTTTPGTTPAPTSTTTTGPPPSPTTPETPRPPISTTTTGPPPSTTIPVVTPGSSPTTGKTTATPGTTPPPSTGQTTTTPGTTPPPTSTTATGPPPSPTTPETPLPPTSTTTTGPPPSTTVVTPGSSPPTWQTTITTTPPIPTTTTGRPPSTPITIPEATTPCVCIINGIQYKPGDTIYDRHHIGSGICLTMICSDICEVQNSTGPCQTPPTPTPTSTVPDCPEWDKVQNETFWICDCILARCIEDNIIEIIPYECPPLQNITCANGKNPVLVWDEKLCCQQYACDCYCEGWGDPHYVTFDGLSYSHQGNCTYVLMEEIHPVFDFKIYVDNVKCDPIEDVSCPRSIIISHKSDVITLKNNNLMGPARLEAQKDGTSLKLPYAKNGVRVSNSGLKLIYEIPKLQVVVTFGIVGFSVNLPYQRFGNNTQGHCGTCNNNPHDDCRLPDGRLVENCAIMADFWPAKDVYRPDCPVPDVVPTGTPIPLPTLRPCHEHYACDLIKSNLFAECHPHISPDRFFDGCVFDSCHMSNLVVECTSLQIYADACAQIGVCVNWRNHTTLCASDCPADKVYNPCGPVEQPTCYSDPSEPRMNTVTEGCFCPEGTKLFSKDSTVCVDKCGCLDADGVAREFNERFEYKCQDCVCEEDTRAITCKAKQCPPPSVISCTQPGFALVNSTDPANPCCQQLSCRCNSSLCPTPNKKCAVGYEPVLTLTEGGCCQDITCDPKNVCVHKGAEYKPGDSVPVIACQECKCTTRKDPRTSLLEVDCKMVECKTDCEPGYNYLFDYYDYEACCGECIQTHCSFNVSGTAHLLEPGSTWSSPDNKCVTYSCTDAGGKFIVTKSDIQCPPFKESNCQPGTIQTLSNGCCQVCEPKNTGCQVETVLKTITYQGCQSQDEVEMAYCEGSCNAFSKYSELEASMKHTCTCCRESKISNRTVTLTCLNDSKVPYTYTHVEQCECSNKLCDKGNTWAARTRGTRRTTARRRISTGVESPIVKRSVLD
ncbi:uncharacterized protein muc2.1 [Alosa pseudoharengus]|uniref:uncharacterized protein muc2.1 n=1 Tax=Alosa pseudoharengus TaxID=34774 RepID=UPI003F88EE7B